VLFDVKVELSLCIFYLRLKAVDSANGTRLYSSDLLALNFTGRLGEIE
jgi:hypothetical protein